MLATVQSLTDQFSIPCIMYFILNVVHCMQVQQLQRNSVNYTPKLGKWRNILSYVIRGTFLSPGNNFQIYYIK